MNTSTKVALALVLIAIPSTYFIVKARKDSSWERMIASNPSKDPPGTLRDSAGTPFDGEVFFKTYADYVDGSSNRTPDARWGAYQMKRKQGLALYFSSKTAFEKAFQAAKKLAGA